MYASDRERGEKERKGKKRERNKEKGERKREEEGRSEGLHMIDTCAVLLWYF